MRMNHASLAEPHQLNMGVLPDSLPLFRETSMLDSSLVQATLWNEDWERDSKVYQASPWAWPCCSSKHSTTIATQRINNLISAIVSPE